LIEKCWCNWTNITNFTNILLAFFAPMIFCQKIELRKASEKTFVQKTLLFKCWQNWAEKDLTWQFYPRSRWRNYCRSGESKPNWCRIHDPKKSGERKKNENLALTALSLSINYACYRVWVCVVWVCLRKRDRVHKDFWAIVCLCVRWSGY